VIYLIVKPFLGKKAGAILHRPRPE